MNKPVTNTVHANNVQPSQWPAQPCTLFKPVKRQKQAVRVYVCKCDNVYGWNVNCIKFDWELGKYGYLKNVLSLHKIVKTDMSQDI